MRHAGLDTTDEHLADTAIVLAAAALHDSHPSVGLPARELLSRRYAIPRILRPDATAAAAAAAAATRRDATWRKRPRASTIDS